MQTKLSVSKPSDPLEKEADRSADRVMRMTSGDIRRSTATAAPEPVAQRAVHDDQVQRSGTGGAGMFRDTRAAVTGAATGGHALPPDVRDFMEPRLGARLADVRIHADQTAHSLSNQLSARAFTYRNHVFFGKGQYQPGTLAGRHLLAHELTHTIQQGAAVRRAEQPEITRAADPSAPEVQRYGAEDALEHFAKAANFIPGFRMLTLAIEFNPITMRHVQRTAAEFLRALIELLPNGAIITTVLDRFGIINEAAAWLMTTLSSLGDLAESLKGAIALFIDRLSWKDIFNLDGLWESAKNIVTDPIDRLKSFGTAAASGLLDLVRRAVLRPLADFAQHTEAYGLLVAVLGKDPITEEKAKVDAEVLIGGFMKLIGKEEIWHNIQEGKAVPRAFAWFKGAVAGIRKFVESIPQKVVATLQSITFADVMSITGLFAKIKANFGETVSEFTSWAGKQVLTLLEILVSVVAPKVMPYIAKAKGAFATIVKNPVAFVGNLVRAGRLGFEKFRDNILTHLKTALIKWITGPLGEAGVYIPQSFDLIEIIKLVLSVLGLTWQNVRTKLVKIIPDPILTGLEKTADVLVTLVKDGPAAAWQQIKDDLTALKDQLLGQVTGMITTEIVTAAVTKLVTMINPAGAVVEAIRAVYNTITFFTEKAQQIGAVVATFIDSIAAIASGQVEGAANKVEQTMANILPLVIGFLAKFVGLGGIPTKLVGIVKKIRKPIDNALDRIVSWLGKILDKLVAKAKDTAKKLLQWWKKKVPIVGGDKPHTLTFVGERSAAKLVVRSAPEPPIKFVERALSKVGTLSSTDRSYIERKTSDIVKLQGKLATFDAAYSTRSQGRKGGRETADEYSETLDRRLGELAARISKVLGAETLVSGVSLPRKKTRWWIQTMKLIVESADSDLSLPKGLFKRNFTLAKKYRKKYGRRHVVSLDDIGRHYEDVLNGNKGKGQSPKTTMEAKVILEQRGSVEGARTKVEPERGRVTIGSIKKAALKRWKTFFNYSKNIFLGLQAPNSSLGAKVDSDHPDLRDDDSKLDAHIAHIKRGWALDGTFEVSK